MTVKQLRNIVNSLPERLDDLPVVVLVELDPSRATVGASPSIGVKWVGRGIDWDAGKFQISTTAPVYLKWVKLPPAENRRAEQ